MRLLRLARGVREHPLLAEADEFGDPEPSMSRFEVNPRSRSTLTSTHRPWQSKPFCQRWSSPSMAWNRWKTSLYVRPQAWWTPIGLFAVMGPSRKLQRGPPAFWARSRSNVRRSRQRPRISCSWATRSGLLLTGSNIGPRLGDERTDRERAPASRGCTTGRHSTPDTLHGGSLYPTRDEPPAGAATSGPLGLHRRIPVAALPGSRPRLRGRLVPGHRLRCPAVPAGRPRARPRRGVPGRAAGRRSPAAGARRAPRGKRGRSPLPDRRRSRRLPGRGLPQSLGRERAGGSARRARSSPRSRSRVSWASCS